MLTELIVNWCVVFPPPETQTFVDKLFEALNSKSYLPQPAPEQPAPSVSRPADSHQRPDKDEPKKEEVRQRVRQKEQQKYSSLELYTILLYLFFLI